MDNTTTSAIDQTTRAIYHSMRGIAEQYGSYSEQIMAIAIWVSKNFCHTPNRNDTSAVIEALECAAMLLRERMLTQPEPEAIKSIMAARRIAAAIKDLK